MRGLCKIDMLLSCASLCLFSLVISAPAPATYKRAIVIGNNDPLPGTDFEKLRYADDDALRFGDFFESLGVKTTVLTTPDKDTLERFGTRAKQAQRPTRKNLLRALEQTAQELQRAPPESEVYFVFSGHGSINASGAYLHLFEEGFTRIDLFERVLKPLKAARIHVIIDSCHSYFLVNSRGKRVAVAEDEQRLDRYSWVGFLLSTSEVQEVQEWSGYQGGVFSYQVLGALRGGADVNNDGIVSYTEVQAYILAANQGIQKPKGADSSARAKARPLRATSRRSEPGPQAAEDADRARLQRALLRSRERHGADHGRAQGARRPPAPAAPSTGAAGADPRTTPVWDPHLDDRLRTPGAQ